MSLELMIQICGIVGIVASFGVVVADILLLGRKDPFISHPSSSLTKRMVGFPFWRINIGNIIGVCLIPLVALGFLPLFFALKPSGFITALSAVMLLGYAFLLGPAGHTSYAHIGSIYRVREGLTGYSPEAKVLDSVLSEQKKIGSVIGLILLTAFIIGSLIYSILVLMGNTYLPIWMAIINPFLLTALAVSSHRWAPAAIAGYLIPACMYAGVIPLQILTLIYAWNAA